MNRLAKCTFVGLAIVPAMALAQHSQTIYKFVDESGRVTYANSPIKGGTKLDLEPLTTIQSPTSAPVAPAVHATAAPAVRPIPVAKVVSVPSSAYSMVAAPVIFNPAPLVVSAPIAAAPASVATPPTVVATLDTNDKARESAQQRRADVRQRILQSEIQAEEKSLNGARAALAEEQRRSNEIRTLRASFAATALVATPQKPLIGAETRAEIERHFERVRNLQDEVAMHEGNVAALREELVATK